MQDKVIIVENTSYSISTRQLGEFPLAFAIRSTHPDGRHYEESLTIGTAQLNLVSPPAVADVQRYLDSHRQLVADRAHVHFQKPNTQQVVVQESAQQMADTEKIKAHLRAVSQSLI